MKAVRAPAMMTGEERGEQSARRGAAVCGSARCDCGKTDGVVVTFSRFSMLSLSVAVRVRGVPNGSMHTAHCNERSSTIAMNFDVRRRRKRERRVCAPAAPRAW